MLRKALTLVVLIFAAEPALAIEMFTNFQNGESMGRDPVGTNWRDPFPDSVIWLHRMIPPPAGVQYPAGRRGWWGRRGTSGTANYGGNGEGRQMRGMTAAPGNSLPEPMTGTAESTGQATGNPTTFIVRELPEAARGVSSVLTKPGEFPRSDQQAWPRRDMLPFPENR